MPDELDKPNSQTGIGGDQEAPVRLENLVDRLETLSHALRRDTLENQGFEGQLQLSIGGFFRRWLPTTIPLVACILYVAFQPTFPSSPSDENEGPGLESYKDTWSDIGQLLLVFLQAEVRDVQSQNDEAAFGVSPIVTQAQNETIRPLATLPAASPLVKPERVSPIPNQTTRLASLEAPEANESESRPIRDALRRLRRLLSPATPRDGGEAN